MLAQLTYKALQTALSPYFPVIFYPIIYIMLNKKLENPSPLLSTDLSDLVMLCSEKV